MFRVWGLGCHGLSQKQPEYQISIVVIPHENQQSCLFRFLLFWSRRFDGDAKCQDDLKRRCAIREVPGQAIPVNRDCGLEPGATTGDLTIRKGFWGIIEQYGHVGTISGYGCYLFGPRPS